MDDLDAVARWRAEVHRAWLDGDPSAEACGHREAWLAGVRVLRSGPAPSHPLLVYLHGGGYALGSPEVALPITERLARGLEIVSVDYRLAPEDPCPAAIDDANAVYRFLLDTTDDRQPILVGGDSAGANLALSIALTARERGWPSPAGLLLFSPHLGVELDRSGAPATDDHRRSDVDRTASAWLAEAYRGHLDPGDPRLSPLGRDLADLPPILIQVGTADTSFEQGVRLARRARAAGVDVVFDVWEGLWHTWHYHRDLPEADRALAEAVNFADHLSSGHR